MFCQNCGTENRDGAYFCNSCGTQLNQKPNPPHPESASCKACGTPIKPGENYCSKCLVAVPNISTTKASDKTPEKKEHGIVSWGAIICGIIIVLFIGAAVLVFAIDTAGNAHTKDISNVVPTTEQPQISKVSTTLTSSTHCAVLVEGKYITDKIEDEATHATSATFETIGSGKATLTISDNTGKNTYSITYYPLMANDPCQGMYIWQGFSEKNAPASGNFLVIGRAPDKIGMFNDAWGNYDSLEFVRV